MTEPYAGSDASAIATRAVKKDGAYELTGRKAFVMAAGEASLYVVLAKVKGGEDLTAFLVPADAPGVVASPPERMMTLRGSGAGSVKLDQVAVPEADRLGAEGDGLRIALAAGDLSRIGIAAIATGLMAQSLEEAKQYSGQREQFKLPLKAFQAIQWKVADMDTQVRAARLLTWYAAAKRDRGEDFSLDAAAAKLFAAEAAKKVTQDSLRVHGGNGFMRDLPLERQNRDARAMSILGGTSEMQRAFLAKQLLEL
jgi:alkylation response protein AidB-like acyl-CoA dehydrogenase